MGKNVPSKTTLSEILEKKNPKGWFDSFVTP